MLTQNEITALSLSPTKKDFVQIWNELLEVAGKLSERWDPTSTNESDPGIVILKAVTGIADKLNYNIDKNILEAFMPTAAQEDSMRKLCEMLGYNVKYYRSATTKVTIKYHSSNTDEIAALESGRLEIPKFTVITNTDQDISYFTINSETAYLSSDYPSITLPCMEGQIVKCESINDNDVITANLVSENNRFYLPETQVAENGIFIYNIFNNSILGVEGLSDGVKWERVDNLNVSESGSRVFKFGYDSYESRPYIEFPEDYSELFSDGIFIYYARTNGAGGNVAARALTRFETPASEDWSKVSIENFSVENSVASTDGSDIETIKQAYNNYKKTIGTFETLVTCRDYMNKIYLMTEDFEGVSGRPLVSNVLVTDIRNDLNRAITICSCDDAGIFYKETSLIAEENKLISTDYSENADSATEISSSTKTETIINKSYVNRPYFHETATNNTNWYLPIAFTSEGDPDTSVPGIPVSADILVNDTNNTFSITETGDVTALDTEGYWIITQNDEKYTTKIPVVTFTSSETVNNITNQVNKVGIVTDIVTDVPAIDHFDLVLYPFKSYKQIKNNVNNIINLKNVRDIYNASFEYSPSTFTEVKDRLDSEVLKTIAHNIVAPRPGSSVKPGDIVSINNYLRLNAVIATNSKITTEEGTFLINKIKIALANAFNMRELDFGEEIPFDSILEVIENADARIRVAALNEPTLYTTYSVLEEADDSSLVVKEYAVKSEWLTDEMQGSIKCLNTSIDNPNFDSKSAKEIYNKLAVRNILAGRIPLFNYNTTFDTNFSEGAYQVAKSVPASAVPAGLPVPTEETPLTVFATEDRTYTGYYVGPDATNIEYTEISVPEEYKEGVISTVYDNAITEIKTNCQVFADKDEKGKTSGIVSDVTLADGEFIKFKAPNFVTSKTYPAYVNYNLVLKDQLQEEANYAKATSLFELLNSDRNSGAARWESVLSANTFRDIKQTVSIKQVISKYVPSTAETQPEGNTENTSGPITITVNNPTEFSDGIAALKALLAKSGCIKLVNVVPTLAWNGDNIPTGSTGPNIDFVLDIDNDNPYIINSSVLDGISQQIYDKLTGLASATYEDGSLILPTECDWSMSFDFEGVPFEAASLEAWNTFINQDAGEYAKALFGFKPVSEYDTVLWRNYGEGYAKGMYILEDTSKLLPFSSSYFGLLPDDNRLTGVYLASSLGNDIKGNYIANGDEYQLQDREYLYIEYTPSSTTEDGTVVEQDAITEILGPGTIIKPSGFVEPGLMDSRAYTASGNSTYKEVVFKLDSGNVTKIAMHSLGANEQIEVRDFARVELTQNSFKSSPAIYLYKNFNGCDALEKLDIDAKGNRINNRYTLKDGEYIFYTDANKTEFAYFTTGTEVILKGKLILEQCEIIDLTTIFDSGLSEIPWKYQSFSKTSESNYDAIIFQEFQYLTLGPKDTLRKITLLENVDCIDSTWQYCDDVEAVSSDGTPIPLQKVNVRAPEDSSSSKYRGNGWQVCSTLDLNTSPNSMQTLRSTDQISTSITVSSKSPSGGSSGILDISAKDSAHPISFKTNLLCQTNKNQLSIDDIYYNPKDLSSFELKIFASEEPSIVKTAINKVVPTAASGITDITNWVGDTSRINKTSYLWYSIDLDDIKVNNNTSVDGVFDKALKLPVNVLSGTYGIFSIYVHYKTVDADNADLKTWIEVLPGTPHNAITFLNKSSNEIVWETAKEGTNNADKLFLTPGINCLRLNKSARFFIKTSEKTSGRLLFDELKLVDCEVVKYTDPNAGIIDTYTQGLNLAQSGYLYTEENPSLSPEIYDKFKTNYITNAFDALDTLSIKQEDSFEQLKDRLLDFESKLKKLVSYTKRAEAEFKTFYDFYAIKKFLTNSEKSLYQTILEQYAALDKRLKDEIALFDALNSDVLIDTTEPRLLSLLESFSNLTDKQQLLYAKLETINAEARAAIEKLSDETILIDFESSSIEDNETQKLLTDKLQKTNLELLEANILEQLTPLIANIESVASSEEHAKLLDIVNKLKESKTNTEINKVLKVLKQLIEAFDQNELKGYLDTILDNAIYVNYQELEVNLHSLKEYLNARDLQPTVKALEQAMVDIDINSLPTLLTTLSDLVSKVTDTAVTEGTIKSKISSILEDLSSNDQDPNEELKEDSEITNAVKELYNLVFSLEYTEKINTLIENINTILESSFTQADKDLLETYADLVAGLDTYTESQADKTIKDIIEILEDRTKVFNDIKEKSLNDYISSYANLPFGEATVLKVWREFITQELFADIASIEKILSVSIRDFKTSDISKVNTAKLKKFIAGQMQTYDSLIQSIDTLAQKKTQNDSKIKLIDDIRKSLAASSPLVLPEAIKNILDSSNTTDSDINYNIIVSLVSELEKAQTLAEKQNAINILKEELRNTIDTDQQLAAIVAEFLCASLFLHEQELPKVLEDSSDSFYKKLVKFVTDYRNILLDNIESSDRPTYAYILSSIKGRLEVVNEKLEGRLLELLENQDIQALKTWLISTDLSNNLIRSFLPDDFLSILNDLIKVAELLNAIKIVKELDFSKMTSTEISEWLLEQKLNTEVLDILNELIKAISFLETNTNQVTDEFKKAYSILLREEQLLNDIRRLDRDHDFYYTTTVESRLAIELNESDSKLNTLMNPAVNYDINNINNNFVISKLDIDYLDSGLTIARSSRLN